MYNGNTFPDIEHLKSGLAISTHSGCTLNCPYCLLHAGSRDGQQITGLASADELVDKLLRPETLFLNGMTPLLINNRTDPFLPEVQQQTLRILEALIERRVTSPVVLISKLFPSCSLEDYCRELPILYIYSYSALPGDFNHAGIRRLDRLAQRVPHESLFHYLRPIIPGRNDDPQMLLNVLYRFSDAGFRGSILSGLRVTRGNHAYLGMLPDAVSTHKVLAPELFRTLLCDPTLNQRRYPLFRHTSCAIDFSMKRANRLGYHLQSGHCADTCQNQGCCEHHYTVTPQVCEQIARRFPNMIFTGTQNDIVIHTPVSQEITAFLKNAFGIRVKADRLTCSPSEEVLLGE